MAKFKIATPAGASFTVAGGGYEYEMEPLEGIDAEIVEGPADEDGFIKFVQDADAIYAKGIKVHQEDHRCDCRPNAGRSAGQRRRGQRRCPRRDGARDPGDQLSPTPSSRKSPTTQ